MKALNQNCVLVDDFSRPFTISKFQSNENKYDVIKALYKLTFSNPILISTPEILFTFVPSIEEFKNSVLTFEKNKDYDIIEIEKRLISLGYKKTETVTARGEFSRRGDILDIFNVTDENPTRLDFFDTTLEEIYVFDFLSFEKKQHLNTTQIVPFKLCNFTEDEKEEIIKNINQFKNEEPILFDIISLIENNEDLPIEFLLPFTNKFSSFLELDLPIVFSEHLQIETLIDNKIENIF